MEFGEIATRIADLVRSSADGYVTKAEIFAILDYIQLMIQPSEKSAQSNDHQMSDDKSNSFADENKPPIRDTQADKEQFNDRETNSKTSASGQANGKPASSNPAKSQVNGSQTNGQLNNQNSTDSGQQPSREANGETNGETNGEANREDNRANDTNTEESNGSIEMEPNRILDIKQCKEKIEQIFQKIDKVRELNGSIGASC